MVKPLQYALVGVGCLVTYALLDFFFANGVIDWKNGIILAILVVIFNAGGDAISERRKK